MNESNVRFCFLTLLIFIKESYGYRDDIECKVTIKGNVKGFKTVKLKIMDNHITHSASNVPFRSFTVDSCRLNWPSTDPITKILISIPVQVHTFKIVIKNKVTGEILLNFSPSIIKREFSRPLTVCQPGTFDSICRPCSLKCQLTGLTPAMRKQICNMKTGACLSGKCLGMFRGPKCDMCPPGKYGNKCQPCSPNCNLIGLSPADRRNICNMSGVCLSRKCKKNFDGPKCDKCEKNRYGTNCRYKCGHCLHNEQCDVITGECRQCDPGYLGKKCDTACQAGRFGMNCIESCHCYRGVPCNPANGSCGSSGCAMRYSGEACNTHRACLLGRYGNTCQPCSPYCNLIGLSPADSRQICNVTTGECLSGTCMGNFVGPNCDKCDINRYGRNCQFKCGNCLHKDECHFITGECTQCEAGYLGNKCDIECAKGRYGFNCEEKCSNCANKDVCHFVTGKCPGNCVLGWKGDKCDIPDECRNGSYGITCNLECHNCWEGRCERITGICILGCIVGFHGKFCRQPCAPGSYGRDCNEFCGVCSNWEFCDSATGKCASGCMGNFIPPFCKDCPHRWFGPECNELCGHCKDGVDCDKMIGHCPDGCADGYTGPFCQTTLKYFCQFPFPIC